MVRLALFDIPVLDLERAVKFYGQVFQIDISIQEERANNYGSTSATLVDQGDIVGVLIHNRQMPQYYRPSYREGCVIYLSTGDEDLQAVLGRVVAAGGKILVPAAQLEPTGRRGYIAWVLDSEGNRIGLQSRVCSDVTMHPGRDKEYVTPYIQMHDVEAST